MNGKNISKYSSKPLLVLSGINLFEGGPLSIYYDCLDAIIRDNWNDKFCVTAFVHSKELFRKYQNSNIHFIELPKSRSNYCFRMYYEYIYFAEFSKKNPVDIWISLHDITPTVSAKQVYTYCHNPSPFRRLTLFDFRMGIKNVLFPLFYKWVYRINIHKASGIIVQEDWIREEFTKLYKVNNIIVARPNIVIDETISRSKKTADTCTFIYPAYPRVFKNYQIICEAVSIINSKYDDDFEVVITIDGSENKYANYLKDKYENQKHIKWIGLINRDELFDLYEETSYLLFPSLMETWGLPITEFQQTEKPIIVADLPYAHETVGNYKQVTFFDPEDAEKLAELMHSVIIGKHVFQSHTVSKPAAPYVEGWDALLTLLLTNIQQGNGKR